MEDSSVFSRSTQDVSSTISPYNMSTGEDASMRAMLDYDPNEDTGGSAISRPLSRSSVTSSLSMVATKDGIEGRKVHRHGIPQYSLNILNSMTPSNPMGKVHSKQQQGFTGHVLNLKPSSLNSGEQLDAISHSNLSVGAPMTLKEKMKLLSYQAGPLQYTSSIESLPDANDRCQSEGQRSVTDAKRSSKPIVDVMTSETDSNKSTNGEDFSYLSDAKNLPPAFVSVANQQD
ncbi:LAME_0F13234g1_1 [Lachancea meyersii CBS 8951]|uniref:LAME_0F13234g1_1 n=1 Tax=Lachancea meyersii CBS 8951 TaxID=1266667 RepID=A0A1G4JXA0_9SACH|nr:LAME_0F13234g1_1 [Lachancea meyersii CBS 8951]